MKKTMALIALTALTIGCSHLIHYENDSALKTTGKYLVRIPLMICTLTISEYVMADITKNHNKRLMAQKWESYYTTNNEWERERLLREINHLNSLNADIDRSVDNMSSSFERGFERGAERAHGRRVEEMRRTTNCTCMDLGSGIISCECR